MELNERIISDSRQYHAHIRQFIGKREVAKDNDKDVCVLVKVSAHS